MKTAFSTLACPDLELREVLSLAARNGMDAVEIRLDRENRLCGYTLEEAEAVKRLIAERGIAISDLATGIHFHGEKVPLEAVAYCSRLAAALGVPALRVFADAPVRAGSEIPKDFVFRNAAALSECADLAACHGVALWVETHSAYSTGERLVPLLEAANRENIRVIWDIMHSIEFGEAPARTVSLLGDQIVHVHLKDGVPPAGTEDVHYVLCALGEGAVSFAEIANALSTVSYDGYLSLEWELMWHPELAACYESSDALLAAYRELLARYF
ncbi:MAG: sugar phosphate isomerase/epimerase [Ruminococcaceae bacterium]|nr:sugar phosphate isomerase/epimerase [Oscillospiraceae bacterium]